MKTSVFENSYRLITRASSITAAMPLPSSQAPGAGNSAVFSQSTCSGRSPAALAPAGDGAGGLPMLRES